MHLHLSPDGRYLVHFQCLVGERLTDEEVEAIIKACEIEEDLEGNVKYEGLSQLFLQFFLFIGPWKDKYLLLADLLLFIF